MVQLQIALIYRNKFNYIKAVSRLIVFRQWLLSNLVKPHKLKKVDERANVETLLGYVKLEMLEL